MCGYDKDYLKDSTAEKKHGSQKLLHWSAKDVANWVCSIELDEYVGAMDSAGIHGAVMVRCCHQLLLLLFCSFVFYVDVFKLFSFWMFSLAAKV